MELLKKKHASQAWQKYEKKKSMLVKHGKKK
jgi:hypothetical protein